eukprot:1182818-Rhodomonas_salina.5
MHECHKFLCLDETSQLPGQQYDFLFQYRSPLPRSITALAAMKKNKIGLKDAITLSASLSAKPGGAHSQKGKL